MPLTLGDEDLPSTFVVADEAAKEGQDETKLLVAWELRLVTIAAVGGALKWRVGSGGLDVFAGLATLAFTAAAFIAIVRAKRQPEQRWYQGRAAAESAKTLAFRYAVGGDPFPIAPADDSGAERTLAERLQEIVGLLSSLQLPPVAAGHRQVTEPMRAARASSFDQRRDLYRRCRVEDQRDWYANRANEHASKARYWASTGVGASVVGVGCGFGRFFGMFDLDLLGIAAAAVAASTAWTHLLQQRTLATSYTVASLELGLIGDRLASVDETDWPLFVSDAEDAVSREHTLWLARRGHPRGKR